MNWGEGVRESDELGERKSGEFGREGVRESCELGEGGRVVS